ncbi:glutamyl-tRNA reductase [Saxibacter everestensis]|uniref:Glutamyl-tRNA reductase n=1 Tax=Saxibacter everestensis TaxID=2909229 RepID=A0ABY8QPS1_9MICO|nr:glutamyl-tRNA reductase [Brevibacteriaceae bacterium ZFBP1038]
MAFLIVGISHRSAPMSVLEKAALSESQVRELSRAIAEGGYVNGVAVLATCNRLEIIADVSTFHGGLADLGGALVDAIRTEWTTLSEHLYVHYEERAVEHLLTVACGLDSMAVGEAQILGQLRATLSLGQAEGNLSSELGRILQQALRVGKRAHSETGLDRVAQSLLSGALDSAPGWLGDLGAVNALVVGAGAMSSLVVANLSRLGVGRIAIANRSLDGAQRLAATVAGRAVELDRDTLVAEVADADLIVSCTGARGTIIGADSVAAARELRTTRDLRTTRSVQRGDAHARRRQFFVDLALPRDIAPEVGDIDDVRLVGLEELSRIFAAGPHHDAADVTNAIAAVRAIIASETAKLISKRRANSVAPTVIALRGRAKAVRDKEFARLAARLGPDVDARVLDEVRKSMHRLADKLMHTPTVRVKELAAEPGGGSYADALRALFDLSIDATGPLDVLPLPGTVFDSEQLQHLPGNISIQEKS